MSLKILLMLKDLKYQEALSSFFKQKFPDCELFTANEIKELPKLPLSSFDIFLASSVLNDGIWLKALPFMKLSKNIILLSFPQSEQINEDVAKKYGVKFFFNVPFNSNELINAVNSIVLSKSAELKTSSLNNDFITSMEKFYSQMESINYYEFFGATTYESVENIKKKYIDIARKYHPDKFRKESPELSKIAYAITKRANEAYSVLSHPNRRVVYDKLLSENKDTKRFNFNMKMNYEKRAIDSIQHPQARRFAELAEKAIDQKQYKPALNQLKMARSMEQNNSYITELIEKVENLIKTTS